LALTSDPSARRDSLTFIEAMLSEIDARGNVGGSATDTTTKGLFGTVTDIMTYCASGHPATRICLQPTLPPAPNF
jgi:hypothetical protein